MWAPGGEFIRDLHYDASLRKKSVDRILSGMIEYGGPLLYHGGEEQQRSFDSTCLKFRRFLAAMLADARRLPFPGTDEGQIYFTSTLWSPFMYTVTGVPWVIVTSFP